MIDLRRTTRFLGAAAVLGALVTVSPTAEATTFSEGRFSLGLSGGGGSKSANIGLGAGYMVLDGLMPSISVGYGWAGHDFGNVHRVETELELRYYIHEFSFLAPFVYVNGGHVFLAFRGTPEEDHNFFKAGGGIGVAFFINKHAAFTINFGMGAWLGADASLFDRGILENPLYDYGFGVSFLL